MLAETIKHVGLTIKIVYDDQPGNPRTEMDNVGVMLCAHRRYNLGDKQASMGQEVVLELLDEVKLPDDQLRRLLGLIIKDTPDAVTDMQRWYEMHTHAERVADRLEAIKSFINDGVSDECIREVYDELERHCVILDVYMYEHGSIALSTSSFSCRWDSGQLGIIYATMEKVAHEWGTGDDARERAEKYLKGEVETYSHYVNGEVYGYHIEDEDGNNLASFFGYYGMGGVEDDAKREAEDLAGDAARYQGMHI